MAVVRNATRYSWRKAGLAEALRWCRDKEVVSGGPPPDNFPGDCRDSPAAALLSDGTVVLSCSDWCGPWSPETPDIAAEPPLFWIGTPVNGHPDGLPKGGDRQPVAAAVGGEPPCRHCPRCGRSPVPPPDASGYVRCQGCGEVPA